jgi:hypothetical protein
MLSRSNENGWFGAKEKIMWIVGVKRERFLD